LKKRCEVFAAAGDASRRNCVRKFGSEILDLGFTSGE
jgi:hypothetical protein